MTNFKAGDVVRCEEWSPGLEVGLEYLVRQTMYDGDYLWLEGVSPHVYREGRFSLVSRVIEEHDGGCPCCRYDFSD